MFVLHEDFEYHAEGRFNETDGKYYFYLNREIA